MFIYKITNISNGKIYIGKTQRNNPNNRFNKHLDALKYNYHPNKHLQAAYLKYGKDKFIFEIIEKTTIDLINERESYFIKSYKSHDPKYGYNKTLGGDGIKPNQELSIKFKSINKGRKHSEQSKKNMSIAHLGQIPWNKGMKKAYKIKKERSEEYRKKISLAIKGKKRANSRKGFKLTEEHKLKLSLAKKGKSSPNKGKKKPGFINKGSFKKGLIPWNKGKKTGPMLQHVKKALQEGIKKRVFTEEYRQKLRDAWVIRRRKLEQSRNNETSFQHVETCSKENI